MTAAALRTAEMIAAEIIAGRFTPTSTGDIHGAHR